VVRLDVFSEVFEVVWSGWMYAIGYMSEKIAEFSCAIIEMNKEEQ